MIGCGPVGVARGARDRLVRSLVLAFSAGAAWRRDFGSVLQNSVFVPENRLCAGLMALPAVVAAEDMKGRGESMAS
jgi:hypothetical protein